MALVLAPHATARMAVDVGYDPTYDDWRVVDAGLVSHPSEGFEPFDVTFHPRSGRARVLPQFARVARLTPPRDPDAYRRERTAAFDADGDRVALAVTTYNVHIGEGAGPDIFIPERAELITSRIGGDPVRLHRCESGEIGAVGVDGDVVAWVGTRCSERDHTTIGVRDLSGGAAPLTLRAPPERAFGGVMVAGDFVAARVYEPTAFPGSPVAPEELVVYRRSTGAEAYRAPLEFGSDLHPDGKVVTTVTPDRRGFCRGTDVTWYSAQEPGGRRLPVTGCPGPAFMANDRIMFDRRLADDSAQAVVTDLDGGSLTELFPPYGPVPEAPPYEVVDFNEDGITYFAQECGRHVLVKDTHAEFAARGPVALQSCPASLTGVPRRAPVDEKGSVVVAVRCPAGCLEAEVRLHDRAAGRDLRLVHQGARVQGMQLIQVRKGATRQVRLTLTPTTRKRLRSEGKLDVELRVSVPQPGKPAQVFRRRLSLLP